MPKAPKLWTLAVVAEYLRISERTAQRWAAEGAFGKTRVLTARERKATGLPWNTRVVRDARYVERLAREVGA